MKLIIVAIIIGTFSCVKSTPVSPTPTSGVSGRPETPDEDEEYEDERTGWFLREEPMNDAEWALYNQNPNRPCPWWEAHR